MTASKDDPLKAAIEEIERVISWTEGLPSPTTGAAWARMKLRDAISALSEAAKDEAAGEREAKYLLIVHGEAGDPASITACRTKEERIEATKFAFFHDGNISGHKEEFAAHIETLEEDEIVRFEGDPPIEWLTAYVDRAALSQPAKEQEPVGTVTISHFRCDPAMENREFDYFGNLPPGTHRLFAAPVQQAAKPYGYVMRSGHGDSFRETLQGVHPEAHRLWKAVVLAPQAEAQSKSATNQEAA